MKYNIEIQSPCSEDWEKMNPTQKGRFCGVCQTEVYDFTKMSDAELIAFIQSGQKVCGRYKKTQLLQEYDITPSSRRWHRYFKYGLSIGLGLLSFVGFGQVPKEKIVVVAKENTKQPSTVSKRGIIRGVVVDSMNEALIGVSIIEKGTVNGVTTDFDGRFELQLLNQVKIDSVVLAISYVGFMTQEILVASLAPESIKIVMKEASDFENVNVVVMGMTVYKPREKKIERIQEPPKKTFWQKIGHFFRIRRDKD